MGNTCQICLRPREEQGWVGDEFGSWPCPADFHRQDKDEDKVNPSHYLDLNPEPLHVIESWNLPFHEAQVIKYISRAGRKGGEEMRIVDLKKARVYLNRRIAQLEKNGK